MRFRNYADVSAHRAFLLFDGWLSLRFVINRLILPLFGVCLTLGLSSEACAQLTPIPPPPARISAQNPSAFDSGAATQAWLDTVPADKRAKSDAYFEGGYWLILWNFLLVAAISLFLLASRISARLRDFAERAARFKPLQTTLYVIPYLLLMYVLSFPLNLYEHFYREHQYGLATLSFAPWFGEQLVALSLTLIIGTILLIVLYAVFRRAPRTWWIWGAIVAVIFSCAATFIAPVYIEPLFNTYKPLSNPEIRDPILAMARANEFPVMQVFVVDATRKT